MNDENKLPRERIADHIVKYIVHDNTLEQVDKGGGLLAAMMIVAAHDGQKNPTHSELKILRDIIVSTDFAVLSVDYGPQYALAEMLHAWIKQIGREVSCDLGCKNDWHIDRGCARFNDFVIADGGVLVKDPWWQCYDGKMTAEQASYIQPVNPILHEFYAREIVLSCGLKEHHIPWLVEHDYHLLARFLIKYSNPILPRELNDTNPHPAAVAAIMRSSGRDDCIYAGFVSVDALLHEETYRHISRQIKIVGVPAEKDNLIRTISQMKNYRAIRMQVIDQIMSAPVFDWPSFERVDLTPSQADSLRRFIISLRPCPLARDQILIDWMCAGRVMQQELRQVWSNAVHQGNTCTLSPLEVRIVTHAYERVQPCAEYTYYGRYGLLLSTVTKCPHVVMNSEICVSSELEKFLPSDTYLEVMYSISEWLPESLKLHDATTKKAIVSKIFYDPIAWKNVLSQV